MAETFGETTKLPTTQYMTADYLIGCKYQSGSAGPLASISAYIADWLGDGNAKCAIYNTALNLLANGTTEEKSFTTGQDGWIIFNFGATKPVITASTNYWLVIRTNQGIRLFRGVGGTNQYLYDNPPYNGWPNPIVPDGYSNYKVSIYATYTEPNQAPTAPSALQVNGKSAPTGGNCISTTPKFSAVYNDPDAGDQANAINIQVGTASGLSDMWNSGWLADSTIQGNRCTAKTYAGTALSAGTSYWWRCRFRDIGNLEGAWSVWQRFDICAVGIGLQCIPGGILPHRRPFTR